jgi:transposase
MVHSCEDDLLESSNNPDENALHGVALGGRNCMLVGSIKAGQASATFYALVETCKLNDVAPGGPVHRCDRADRQSPEEPVR